MKELIIHPYLYQPRGAEKQVLNLTNNLNKMGENASILTFFSKKSSAIGDLMKNINIITNPKLPFFKYIHMFYPPIILFKNYKKIFKDFDIINVHNFPATWAIRNSGKPVVWMCNEVPWEYAPSRRMKFFFNFIQKIYRKIDYKLIRKNVKEIVVLDEKRKKDVKKYYGFDAKIVRSGIDISRYFPLSKNKARREVEKYSNKKLKEKVILFVSNLSPPKRLEDFLISIDLLNEKENITALIVGSGPEESIISSFSKKINIVHIKDAPEELMPSIYNSANIFIFPAINQPWGLVPFEAMACKVPTIVSKDTGASEVLKHLNNSILVGPNNPKEIAKYIQLLFKNRTIYKKISSEGYDFVINNLTTKKYAEEMLELFKKVLKDSK